MTFDGINWSEPALISAYAYAPLSPFGPDVIARSMLTSYFEGRKGGRRLLQQSYGFNGAVHNGGGTNVLSTGLVAVADSYATIETEWTHVRAAILYSAYAFVVTEAHHRVLVNDGTTTNTGTTITREVPAGVYQDSGVEGAFLPSEFASAHQQLFIEEVSVSLSGLTLPCEAHVIIEGNVDGSLAGLAASYRVYYAVAWAEVNGG